MPKIETALHELTTKMTMVKFSVSVQLHVQSGTAMDCQCGLPIDVNGFPLMIESYG